VCLCFITADSGATQISEADLGLNDGPWAQFLKSFPFEPIVSQLLYIIVYADNVINIFIELSNINHQSFDN